MMVNWLLGMACLGYRLEIRTCECWGFLKGAHDKWQWAFWYIGALNSQIHWGFGSQCEARQKNGLAFTYQWGPCCCNFPSKDLFVHWIFPSQTMIWILDSGFQLDCLHFLFYSIKSPLLLRPTRETDLHLKWKANYKNPAELISKSNIPRP